MPRTSIFAVAIVCPSCGKGLDAKAGSSTLCEGCGAAYPARPGRGPDLRPRSELVRSVRERIPAADAAHPWEESLVDKLRPGTGPSLAEVCADPYYSYGNRMSPDQASRLQLRPGYRLLDVGCGADNFMRSVIAALGVDFVGVDYSGEAPDFLVDAHVLPFPDDSFDGVMSLAVLEHVHNPYRVVQEVARVLRPGGVFVGTVAFLEPFHLESLLHHSAYGTWSVLQEADFVGIEIAPNRSWDVARANVEMGLIPAGSRREVRWWVGSALSRAAHWRLSREPVATYARFTAGFRFIAELPG
jgi:SAM-dependent methyltransferase